MMVLTTMEAVCHGKSLRGLISSSFASSSSFISLRKPSALFPLQPKKTFVSLSQHAPGQNTFPLASSSFSLSLPSSVSSSTSSCGAGDCFARRPSFEGHRRCARRSICSVSASSVEQEEEKLLREILKDLESLRQSVKSAARQFKSPMFQQYFLRRADEDFEKMGEKLRERRQSFSSLLEEVNKFREDMEKHRDLLHRQSIVGNLYHTDRIVYLK